MITRAEAWKNAELILLFKKGENFKIRTIGQSDSTHTSRSSLLKLALIDLFKNLMPTNLQSKQDFTKISAPWTIFRVYEPLLRRQHLAVIDFQKTFDNIEITETNGRYQERLSMHKYKNATFHVKVNDDLRTEKNQIGQGSTSGLQDIPQTIHTNVRKSCYSGKKRGITLMVLT